MAFQRRCFAVVAVIAWGALALQVWLVAEKGFAAGQSLLLSLVNTFSYFTVLTNLLVAVVAAAMAGRRPRIRFLTSPSTLAAAAVYILVVGLVYSLLLRDVWEPTGLQLVADVALHDLVPVAYLACWLFLVPKGALHWRLPALWLAYPLAFVALSLLRGLIDGRYFYYFADASVLGYPRVFLNAALLLAGFALLGLIVVAIDRLTGRLGRAETSVNEAGGRP